MNERVLLLLASLEKGNPSAPSRSFSSCLQEDRITTVALQIPKIIVCGRTEWQFPANVVRYTSKCCVAGIQTIQLKNPGTLQRKSCGKKFLGRTFRNLGNAS